jgi:plasmid stability protein
LNFGTFLGVFRFAKMSVRRTPVISPRGEVAIYRIEDPPRRCCARSWLIRAIALTNMIAMIAGVAMASITIRNLDDALKRKLRLRAAHRNRSMEDEARDILRTALAQEPAETQNLADAIRELVEPFGGVELELPPRGPMPEPPNFK